MPFAAGTCSGSGRREAAFTRCVASLNGEIGIVGTSTIIVRNHTASENQRGGITLFGDGLRLLSIAPT